MAQEHRIAQNAARLIRTEGLLPKEVEDSTSHFMEAAAQVARVLEVLDPALLLTFGSVYGSKGGSVVSASKIFSGQVAQFDVESQPSTDKLRRISYTLPPKPLMAVDLEVLYQSLANRPLPRGMLAGGSDTLASRLPHKSHVDHLAPTDVVGIQELGALLKDHLDLVHSAREKLREFIAAIFSIGDLLCVGTTKTAYTGLLPTAARAIM